MKSAEEWIDTVVVFTEDAARAIQLDALKRARRTFVSWTKKEAIKQIDALIEKLERSEQ